MKGLTVKAEFQGLDRLKQAAENMQAALKELEEAAAEVTFSVGDGAGNERS